MPDLAYSYREDPAVPAFADDQPLFVFDGKCVLCSATVQFIFRHDRQRRIRFVTAQSPLGDALYRHYGLKHEDYETNILVEKGRALIKSESSIRIFELVGWPWSLMAALRVVPCGIRDWVYEIVARNRYKWFGVRESCYLPDPADRARFIG